MSKRVAYIFKGCISDGVNPEPLKHLDNNVKKIKEVLEENGAWKVKCFNLDNAETLKSALSDVMEVKDIEEFLFYYTGHGKGTKDAYYLIGKNEKRINLLDAFSLHDTYTQKVSVIVDACESHTLINIWDNRRPYELFVATKTGLAHEGNLSEMSDFSHCFYEAFQNIVQDSFQLLDIHQYMKGRLSEQESDYNPTKSRVRSVIGYNKEINEIYQLFKEKYTKSDDLKKAILNYLKDNVLNFKTIQSLIDYKKLFEKLLEEKECLYCLLKELNLDKKYINRVKEVDDCSKLKREIAQQRSLTSIILVIRNSTNNSIKDCTITCHEEKSDGSYNIASRSVSKVDFSNKESYEEAIISLLLDKQTSDCILELKLVLPIELFNVDFESIEIKAKFGNNKSLREVFHISKKILMRFEEYRTEGYFERWKKNQIKLQELHNQSIEEHTFLVDEKEKVSLFGKRVISGGIKKGKKQEYLTVHSFYPLVEEKNIFDMIEYGVPIVLSTKEYEKFRIEWEECLISDMKLVFYNHLDYHQNRLFIHDNYNEVVSLQKAIEA